jgi:hypothetical protein
MSCFIHSKLDIYINYDSNQIKKYNEDIKIEFIKDKLSQLMGWNSFYELEKEVNRFNSGSFLNNLKLKKMVNFETLTKKELDIFKSNYMDKIKENFPFPIKHYSDSFDGKKFEPYDLYEISHGLLYNHENIKKTVVKEGVGMIEISTLNNDTLIELNNDDFKKIVYLLLDLNSSTESADGIWKGRSLAYIDLIFDIIKHNDDNSKAWENKSRWQFELSKYFTFESIVREWIDCQDKKFKFKIYSKIRDMPAFPTDDNFFSESNDFGRMKGEELYWYMLAPFFAFNKPMCLNLSNNVRLIYNLDELKKTNKKVVLTHYDNVDNNNISTIIRLMLSKEPNAIRDYLISLID